MGHGDGRGVVGGEAAGEGRREGRDRAQREDVQGWSPKSPFSSLASAEHFQNYPKQPPQLVVADPNNLSPDHVKALSKLLQEKAKALVGEEMIFTARHV
jgi:hypothetical protein